MLLGDRAWDPQWMRILGLLCIKISADRVLWHVLLCALACQLLYSIRFFLRTNEILEPDRCVPGCRSCCYRRSPSGTRCPGLGLRDAYLVAFLPCLIMFFKCFADIRLLAPEIGRVVRVLLESRRGTRPAQTAAGAFWGIEGLSPARQPAGSLGSEVRRILGLKGSNSALRTFGHGTLALAKQYHPDHGQSPGAETA